MTWRIIEEDWSYDWYLESGQWKWRRTGRDIQVAGAQGSVDIAAPPARVFEVLLDPVALARVIPGCHALQSDGPNRYRADVTVGVGLIKARYEAPLLEIFP